LRSVREGEFFRLEMVSSEDLWYLSLLIREGDIVKADVFRRTEIKEDMVRRKKTERRKVSVSIKVESVEFSELQMRLHILGEIVEGPEDYLGEHQSVNVEPGSFISVKPSDLNSFMKILEESSSLSYARTPVLSIDEKGVSLFLVDEEKNELSWRVQTAQGKMFQDERSDPSELRERLARLKGQKVYLIGPQVLRGRVEGILEELRIAVEKTEIGESGEEGIRILLSSGHLEMRRSAEMRMVEDFLKGVNSGLSAYGKDSVSSAVIAGAADVLIITDRYFRENKAFQLLEECRAKGCRVFIVHSSWETGKIVDGYGGIVAILRYKLIGT